jgi:predicted ATP-grasp superfamily ATP-dependent carboligase
VPVGIVDDEKSISGYSRYARFFHKVSSLRDEKQTIQALREVAQAHDVRGWVLFPTRDETVAAISANYGELAEIYRVPTSAWQTIQWLWDKRKTYRLAQDLGIPAPKTWYPKTIEDLDELEGHFPLVIKPAIKEHFFYATKDKGWRADDLDQLRKLYQRACEYIPADEVMVQDFVPGGGSCQYAYCSFFKAGNPVASLVACRQRQHPLELGRASTFVETVELPLLEEYSQRFLKATSYYGLVEVEYKRDPRDGQFRLLDVNGRTWGYHTIGGPAGVDFPYLLFCDQIHEPITCSRGKSGVRWIRLLTDVPTGVVAMFKGEVKALSYLRSLMDYHEEAVFSWEDPLPGLMELALVPYLCLRRGF